MAVITLQRQIQEAERELEMRKRNYPLWVKAGKMKKDVAAYQIQAQEAIIMSLKDKKVTGMVPATQVVQGSLFNG